MKFWMRHCLCHCEWRQRRKQRALHRKRLVMQNRKAGSLKELKGDVRQLLRAKINKVTYNGLQWPNPPPSPL